MIRSAPMKGAHVMSDRYGIPRIMSARPLDPDDQEEQAERHPVHVVLGLPGLDAAEPVAGLERPRAEEVDDAVDDVAVEPADRAREPEEHPAIDREEDGVDPEAGVRGGAQR